MVLYTKGFSESFKKVCNKVGVQVHLMGNNSIHNLLIAPMDKDIITQRSGISTGLNVPRQVVRMHALRNQEGPSGAGLRIILGPLLIYEHSHSSGHYINVEKFSIVGKEVHGITSTIMEAMFIRVNDPSLNWNLSKFQLSCIWNEV